MCQSALVDEALRWELFSWDDDVENLYRPFDGALVSPNECVSCLSGEEYLDSETGECADCYEENQQPQEIFEWWAVSNYLKKKLMESGEPILANDYGTWWGRCTSGQAIILDSVIEGYA